MKKAIKIIILIVILIPVVYYGVVRNGFSYFTGIGTPYSYFHAQKATHDSILVFYEQELIYPAVYINYDSLELAYGFKTEYSGSEVSSSVMNLYNSTIRKELVRRLGKRWNEYLFKVDSMQNVKLKIFRGKHLKIKN